jgi:hypothetical protein
MGPLSLHRPVSEHTGKRRGMRGVASGLRRVVDARPHSIGLHTEHLMIASRLHT